MNALINRIENRLRTVRPSVIYAVGLGDGLIAVIVLCWILSST